MKEGQRVQRESFDICEIRWFEDRRQYLSLSKSLARFQFERLGERGPHEEPGLSPKMMTGWAQEVLIIRLETQSITTSLLQWKVHDLVE